jgi:Spy/CpxP family protein refolding chaperone
VQSDAYSRINIYPPMLLNPKNLIAFGFVGVLVASVFAAAEITPLAPTSYESKAAEYARKLDERVTKIVAALDLKDPAKAARLHALIVAQYRSLNVWHETYDARLKELGKLTTAADVEKAAAAKTEMSDAKSALKTLHDHYLAQLAAELTPDQVEQVKDGMTVGKVQFTYGGYLQQNPGFTAEQKTKVLELLKAAREEAIDAGSMDEKSAIFNRYKGKINNYLSTQKKAQAASANPTDAK